MDDKRYPFDSDYDDGVYGTGCTEPPKNHSAVIAILLIAVIFLGGISTALSVLNIRLFQELNRTEEQAVAFAAVRQKAPKPSQTVPPTTLPAQEEPSAVAFQTPAETRGAEELEELTLQEIYEKNIPSVVSITAASSGQTSTGTGVVVADNGYVVTNHHVIDGAQSFVVRLTDEREFQAKVVGADLVSDLAVLRVDAENLTEAEFGDSESLRVGDAVVAIGDPLGVELRGTMTDGIVSAINRDVCINGRYMNLIQTNAALNSGNSGGPLINIYGQVVGINTMKIGAFSDKSGVEGLGFAIPSSIVEDVVGQIIRQGYVSGRPWLGITGESLSPFYQRFYHVPAGLYITRIDPESPAEVSGLLPGDILLQADGFDVYTMDDLNARLYSHDAGDLIALTLFRNGVQAELTLRLAEKKG